MSKQTLRWPLVAAVLAVGAFVLAGVAPVAAAAGPEFWECAKAGTKGAFNDTLCSEPNEAHKGDHELQPVTHKCGKAAKVEGHFTGAFNNNKCTVPNPTHEGEFEFKPGVALNKPFKGSLSGEIEIELKGQPAIPMKCKGGTIEGLVTGAASIGNVKIVLKECEEHGYGNCTTGLAAKGRIETTELSGPVLGPAEAPRVVLSAAGGSSIAQFNCELLGEFRLVQDLTMGLSEDINHVSETVRLTAFEGEPGLGYEEMIGGEWAGPGVAVPRGIFTAKGEALELRV